MRQWSMMCSVSGSLRCHFRLRYTRASTTPLQATLWLLYVTLPVALEPPSAEYRCVICACVFSIKSLRSVYPCGAQLPEFQGLHFGSLYTWSTASSERLDDSYRNRKTKTDATRLHAGYSSRGGGKKGDVDVQAKT